MFSISNQKQRTHQERCCTQPCQVASRFSSSWSKYQSPYWRRARGSTSGLKPCSCGYRTLGLDCFFFLFFVKSENYGRDWQNFERIVLYCIELYCNYCTMYNIELYCTLNGTVQCTILYTIEILNFWKLLYRKNIVNLNFENCCKQFLNQN